MVGGRAELACNSSLWKSGSGSEMTPVSLVSWFQEGVSSKTPIYTLDARNQVSLSRSRHIPSPTMKDRGTKFDLSLNPPRLVLRNVSKADEGLFRCRVRRRPVKCRHPCIHSLARDRRAFLSLPFTPSFHASTSLSRSLPPLCPLTAPFITLFAPNQWLNN